MEYIDPERIRKAKEMDLLTYKQLYEPWDIIRTGNNSYKLKSEPALKLSNGKWCWWDHDAVGGKSALKYLETVQGMEWQEAVKRIEGVSGAPDYSKRIEENRTQNAVQKELILPEKNASAYRMERYLTGRGISMNVIKYCEEKGLLYEDSNYHNAVFLGFDGDKPAYAFCRGTGDKKVMIEARGSRKEHSFRMMAEEKNTQVHVFEAAIDALSYASLMEMYGVDFRKKNLLSLGGIAGGRTENGSDIKPPPALLNYLSENPQTEAVVLHLDSDEPGRSAAAKIKKLLEGIAAVKDSPPPEGKDCNDFLKITIKKRQETERTDVKNGAGNPERASPAVEKTDAPAVKNNALPDAKNASVSGENLSGEAKKPSVQSAEYLRDGA